MNKLLFVPLALLLITCTTEVIEDLCPSHKADACYDMSGLSSSSRGGANSSSSGRAIVYGTLTDPRDDKTYRTVVIGTQTWMAENINFYVEGSRCNGVDTNCSIYGRFYTWEMAMNACPDGWRLPSDTDWGTLINYVDGAGGSEAHTSSTAGRYLKTTSGWTYENAINGTDNYGFSAMPGGGGFSDPPNGSGGFGHWWSSTTSSEINAYEVTLGSISNYFYWMPNSKRAYDAVRCIEGAPASSSSSVTPSSSSSWVRNVVNGESVTYGGETYETVIIGEQTWMARNLNYNPGSGSRCYNDNTSNCTTYGRLYTWNAALTACPVGYKLPTKAEWETLLHYVDGGSPYDTSNVGVYLKAASGWDSYSNTSTSTNGWDIYGFAALPGGWHQTINGTYNFAGQIGMWWSATDSSASTAYHIAIYQHNGINWWAIDKGYWFSVRCLKDESVPSSSSVTPSSSSGSVAPASVPFFEDFEQGINNWTVPTTTTNHWVVGTGTYYGGSRSAYITNGSGNAYTTTLTGASNIYREITFPSQSENFTFSFYWKGSGENTFDYMTVYLVPSSVIVTNTKPSSSYQIGSSYNGSSSWTQVNINLPASTYGGKTYKLVFHWQNDSSAGTQPPAAIDNISIGSFSTFTDTRTGGNSKVYKTVTFGGVTWMAENLNYIHHSGDSECYGGSSTNCTTYGRLYDGYDANNEACPVGWRLPSLSDWSDLVDFAGGTDEAAMRLKATTLWNDYTGGLSGVGTDNYRFTALPGGYYDFSADEFRSMGDVGFWWTSTDSEEEDKIYNVGISKNNVVDAYSDFWEHKLSVRCVKETGTIGRLLPKRAVKPAAAKPAVKSAAKSIRGVGVRGR